MCKIFSKIAFLTLVLYAHTALAGVDENSVFSGARSSASELDLRLLDIQNTWQSYYVTAPDDKAKKKHPLIIQAGLSIRLYYSGNDLITANAYITKLDGFLKLSPTQRKKLVSNALNHLFSFLSTEILVDKKTGLYSKNKIQKNNLVLMVRVSDITRDDKNNEVPVFLPSDIGYGQAGYKDGQYVYSEDYFLKLKIKNGIAASGDANRYIIENE